MHIENCVHVRQNRENNNIFMHNTQRTRAILTQMLAPVTVILHCALNSQCQVIHIGKVNCLWCTIIMCSYGVLYVMSVNYFAFLLLCPSHWNI